MANVLISQNDSKGALKVITRLAKSHGVDLEIASMIETLLQGTKYDTRSPEQNELYLKALQTVVTESPKPTDDTCKKLFTQLNRSGAFEAVIAQAVGMKERWNFYSSPMEWLCRYYIEGRLDASTIQKTGSFDVVTDKLFKLYPSSSFGHFARGKFLIDSGLEMSDGFSFITTGLESNYNFYALVTLIHGRLSYGDFERAVEDCTNGLRAFANEKVCCRKLRLFCAEAWVWLDFKKAQELLENIKSDLIEPEDQSHWILLNVQLQAKQLNFDSLSKFVGMGLEKNVNHWLLQFYNSVLSLDMKDRESVKSAVARHLEEGNKENNFYLSLEASILLYNLGYYKESAECFVNLTNTEIGRRRPIPWKYLGKLYALQDATESASKCYKKAYKLCPSAEVGALLSDTYFLLGKDEPNLELLTGATKSFVKNKSKWAWLRLGILNLHKGEANDAVTALQAAIRADINDW